MRKNDIFNKIIINSDKYISNYGINRLNNELKQLIDTRPILIKNMNIAKSKGDLSENFEFTASLSSVQELDRKIQNTRDKVISLISIDISKIQKTNLVSFGSTLTLTHTNPHQSIKLTIVGKDEADIESKAVSISFSEVKKLLNKKIHDIIEYGLHQYTLTNIEYLPDFFKTLNDKKKNNNNDDIFDDLNNLNLY